MNDPSAIGVVYKYIHFCVCIKTTVCLCNDQSNAALCNNMFIILNTCTIQIQITLNIVINSFFKITKNGKMENFNLRTRPKEQR